MPDLDELRRVIRRIETARPSRPAPEPIERVVDGELIENEHGRVVVVTEAVRRCSIASDVVALIAEHAFDRLLAAPRIVSAPDAPPPPPTREDAYFPNAGSIAAAIREALDG